MALLSSLLLIIVLSTLHPAVCQGTGVISVYISSSLPDGEYNCTLSSDTAGHIVCPNLTAALINCKSNLTADLKFVIVSENQFPGGPGQSLTYEVVNSVSLQGNGNTVYCNGFSLEFVSGGRQSFLSFDNITFHRCGNGSQVGVKISVMNSLNMSLVTFDNMLGITLQNIANLTIVSSIFQKSSINPFAVLRIEYDSFLPIIITEVTVTLTGCRFFQNFYDNTMLADTRNSGQLAVLIYQVVARNFIFDIDSCNFTSTSAYRFSPMFLLLNVNDSSVLVNVNGLRYVSNKQGLLIEMDNFNNSDFSFSFNQSLFHSNINDPNLANDGLLTINSHNSKTFNETINFSYNGLNFTNNYGMIMYASSVNANATHILNECTFNGNRQALGAQMMFSFNGSGIDVILSNMRNFSDFLVPQQSPTDTRNQTIVFVRLANSLTIDNVDFTGTINSIATMLTIDTVSEVVFRGLVYFSSFHGVHGGALSIRGSTRVTITNESVITFYNNYADYGGAMYIDINNLNVALTCDGKIDFVQNVARVSGGSLYTTDNTINLEKFKNCFNSVSDISTMPSIISLPKSIRLFPGKIIRFYNVIITGGLGNNASCNAKVSLICNNSWCEYTKSGLQLKGPSDTFLYELQGEVNTLLYIKSNVSQNHRNENLVLRTTCIDPFLPLQSSDTEIEWISEDIICPVGFKYQNILMICLCSNLSSNGYQLLCMNDYGIACIKKDLWVSASTNVIISCPYPFCSINRDTEESKHCKDYYGPYWVALPLYESEQCAYNRNGRRCSQCQNKFYFTFGGIKCTQHCKASYPFIIAIIAVILQFLIFSFILAAMKLDLDIGSGFMYGPLLFLAIVGQMHFGYYPNLMYLKTVVRLFASIFLENLEIIGEISMCFVDSLFVIQLFYFLGPLLMWLMLLLLVVVGRCCPRLLTKIQKSPMQAICVMMMLSFWSLANASIILLKPLKIGKEYFTEVDPTVNYFSGSHILIGFIAIAVLAVVIIPFIALLAMSNFEVFNRKFRLYRFKPIFDEFQSCYVDKHRWYCVVYFISFIIYLILAEYPLGPQLLLLLLLSLHFIIQPYKKHIFNIIDMLLLLDLLFLCSILDKREELENGKLMYILLIYIMTLVPLLYIVVGSVGIFFLHCMRRMKVNRFNFSSTASVQQENDVKTFQVDADDEREPLIRMMQNEEVKP